MDAGSIKFSKISQNQKGKHHTFSSTKLYLTHTCLHMFIFTYVFDRKVEMRLPGKGGLVGGKGNEGEGEMWGWIWSQSMVCF